MEGTRMRMWVAVVLGVSVMMCGVVYGFETEVKPNNYPNFAFQESPNSQSAEVKPQNYESFQFVETNDKTVAQEVKPNNYPNFEYSDSPGFGSKSGSEFAQQNSPSMDMPNGRSRFPSSNNRFSSHDYVYNANEKSTLPDVSGQSFYSTDIPTFSTDVSSEELNGANGASLSSQGGYKGSDARNRYPSSYDLINSRNQGSKDDESFGSSEMRFNSEQKTTTPSTATPLSGSSRFYSPSSDPDFAFRFAMPETSTKPENSFGANSFKSDNAADNVVYSAFNFDNSDATNDPTATYGTTTPVLASNNVNNAKATTGHGCANMYWAEHTKQWPSFFSINTQVAQAFGTKAGSLYGTTTLLQALYDNRPDGYSKLLSHGTAALLNSYTMPNYALRHDAVIDQFLAALPSRTTAGVQAQKFQNSNQAYGPNECKN